jgi:hypothetical protein
MRRRWFDMGHKSGHEEPIGNGKEKPSSQVPDPMSSAESLASETEGEAELNTQLELLSMDDIYRMAGILNPCKGYSINKIVEMLHSEHLRGLARDLKCASVLMALDAAEISVEEVCKTRRRARTRLIRTNPSSENSLRRNWPGKPKRTHRFRRSWSR